METIFLAIYVFLNHREMVKIYIYISNFLLEFSAFFDLSKLGVYYKAISVLEIHNEKLSMEMT